MRYDTSIPCFEANAINHVYFIMSSRKRKLISIPEKEGKSSKRAKLLSDLWRSKEVENRTVSSNSSQSSRPSPVYNIKAIVRRRGSQYSEEQVNSASTRGDIPQVSVRATISLQSR